MPTELMLTKNCYRPYLGGAYWPIDSLEARLGLALEAAGHEMTRDLWLSVVDLFDCGRRGQQYRAVTDLLTRFGILAGKER